MFLNRGCKPLRGGLTIAMSGLPTSDSITSEMESRGLLKSASTNFTLSTPFISAACLAFTILDGFTSNPTYDRAGDFHKRCDF